MEVLIGRSSFIPICVGDGIKKEFMGPQKLGCVSIRKMAQGEGRVQGRPRKQQEHLKLSQAAPQGGGRKSSQREGQSTNH